VGSPLREGSLIELSLWLPTYVEGGQDFTSIGKDAAHAEQLGFDGIFLLDHLLPIAGVHRSAWLDTIVGLAAMAVATERVRLGTASMVVGFRHPVYLAKQLASVASIAGPRLVLGAGSGWYGPEYEALGFDVRHRGAMTDETLEAVRLLLSENDVTFHGEYWRFDDVTISPRPADQVPVWVGGGSRAPEAGSDRDVPRMARGVLDRILRWDGWIAPCAGDEAMTYRDLHTVQHARRRTDSGRDGFRLAHVQWIHAVETDDRDRALAEQFPRFRALMGEHHSDQHLVDTYLLGSRSDIVERVTRLKDAGFDELIVGPVVRDYAQTQLIAEVLGEVRGHPSARSTLS
jgi:alkanesulfonate monooxygenase SsuD/methylene tetrahydromethanopterin reductase-like flavin-dependent oxidoreductase (luciferase family)